MILRLIDGVLAAVAAVAVMVGRVVAPRRDFDVYPHRDHRRVDAAGQPLQTWPWRVDAWMMDPSWFFLVVGRWTLEVSWTPREELEAADKAREEFWRELERRVAAAREELVGAK